MPRLLDFSRREPSKGLEHRSNTGRLMPFNSRSLRENLPQGSVIAACRAPHAVIWAFWQPARKEWPVSHFTKHFTEQLRLREMKLLAWGPTAKWGWGRTGKGIGCQMSFGAKLTNIF